jgi:hypothetical protein
MRTDKPDSFWLDALAAALVVSLIILFAGTPDLMDVVVEYLMLNVCE